MVACKKVPESSSISGYIEGLGTDTIYLYGADGLYTHIDTIYVQDSRFEHLINVDTITCAYLLFKKQIEYPIFIDKHNQITVKGDTANLHSLLIDGNVYNLSFTEFQKSLNRADSLGVRTPEEKAEEFIRQHPSSYVSLYLLDKYFLRKEVLNYGELKSLSESMSGILQDKSQMTKISDAIAQSEKIQEGRFAPYFSLPNVEGEKISRTSKQFKDRNLLICFWASWADSLANSRNNEELRTLYRTYKQNKYLSLLGVAFDFDKQLWLDAIARDSLEWEQVYSADAGNSELMKLYCIRKLPCNVLLSPEGRILAMDLHGKELREKIEKVIQESEKKDKKKNN